MPRTVARAVPILLAAVLLAGCAADEPADGQGRANQPAAAASPSAEPAEPAEPAHLTREEAARRYLKIVRPYNKALERWETAVNSGSMDAAADAADDAATALEKEVAALRKTPWPPKVERQAAALADACAKRSVVWREEMAAAETVDDVYAALDALAQAADDDGPATKIRRLLDLDRYEESDYQG